MDHARPLHTPGPPLRGRPAPGSGELSPTSQFRAQRAVGLLDGCRTVMPRSARRRRVSPRVARSRDRGSTPTATPCVERIRHRRSRSSGEVAPSTQPFGIAFVESRRANQLRGYRSKPCSVQRRRKRRRFQATMAAQAITAAHRARPADSEHEHRIRGGNVAAHRGDTVSASDP